ncbi:YdeI/OmpD-associated family protein [Streptomyces sp. NPDC059802]|uniref:YdeI/OmpD-associated family protein n=1 Tax=Streptomyces sp. NPDC059802 TaxID=3346952 RepID=UPI00365A5208
MPPPVRGRYVLRGRKGPSQAGERDWAIRATAPPDLVAALDVDPGARKAFEALGRSERYQLILPLLQALTPETRKARLDKVLHRLVGGDPAG